MGKLITVQVDATSQHGKERTNLPGNLGLRQVLWATSEQREREAGEESVSVMLT